MKKLFALTVCMFFVSDAFADDWRMKKYDLDADGLVSFSELKMSRCPVKQGLFNRADTSGDGFLNKKELRKSSTYTLNRCKGIPVDVRG